MKIKTVEMAYEEVLKLPKAGTKRPLKQAPFWRWLIKTLAKGELKAVNFKCEFEGMDGIPVGKPCLYLMNHSSFTDLMIAGTLLSDTQYHIVCTNDGFVGKELLMRLIGCIPAKKFIADLVMVKDMKYAVDKLGSSILMYPEASYSFDGTETPLPDSIGKFVKLLNIPVIMIKTEGAFLRDPLYNCLQKRKTDVTCKVYEVISETDIPNMSPKEINMKLKEIFKYDHFRAQSDKKVKIDEAFRADGLHRVLYKCPECKTEGKMVGKGTSIKCGACDKTYTLTEYGKLEAAAGKTAFEYVSDWYKWQRAEVLREIKDGSYEMSFDADIIVYCGNKAVYRVGEGVFTHNCAGFKLEGCDGQLQYVQSPKASYSLYSDYFWYEIGDMISIGDTAYQYYCFPKKQDGAIVAKARLATEEMYKLSRKHSEQ